jgi:hypothetical protein
VKTLARDADWRSLAPLQGTHTDLMRLAGGRGMVDMAATQYATPDWALVLVCVHEAGHAAVASALGCRSSIEIERRGRGFSGLCFFQGASRRSAERPIALAGKIAEHLGEYGFWSKANDLLRAVDPSYLSDSDRILAGSFTSADVEAVTSLVRKQWPAVIAVANRVLAQQVARWEH